MSQQFFPFSFLKGSYIKTENANVSIMTNALQYGTGIFGGIRGYYSEKTHSLSIFRLDDHIERFCRSLKVIGVSIPYSAQELKKIILTLTEKNQPKTDMYCRPFAYASSHELSPNLARDSVFDFSCYMIPLGEYLPVDKGLSVAVSSWRRISDNSIPSRAKVTGGYINSALARKEADDKGCDEAIFLTENGHVCEGSAENIFIVREGILITPAKSEDILEGITRRTIIRLAHDLKIPVEERVVARTELYTADEAFFSGTGVQVSWISKVDGRLVGNGKKGKITGKLVNLFFDIVHGNNKKYSRQWCTTIKTK